VQLKPIADIIQQHTAIECIPNDTRVVIPDMSETIKFKLICYEFNENIRS